MNLTIYNIWSHELKNNTVEPQTKVKKLGKPATGPNSCLFSHLYEVILQIGYYIIFSQNTYWFIHTLSYNI